MGEDLRMTHKRFWQTPGGYRWAIFLTLSIVYFLACLHRISPTVIARDLMREFTADATALGLMASAYFYLYAAVQPPVGMLSDTLGPRRVTTLFACIACGGAVLFGLAPNLMTATIGRALIGIGVGGVFVPTLKIFSRWYRPKEFAAMTGVLLAFGNVGNLSASLPLTYLVLAVGWRMSFVAIGGISLVMAMICWWVVRDTPEEKGWPPVAMDDDPSALQAQAAPAGITTLRRIGMIFATPAFWMVTGSYFFFGGPMLAFQGLWTVPYLMDVHQLSRVAAGGLLMIMPIGFIVGAPLFGVLADRLPVGRKSVLLIGLLISTACWSVMLLTHGHPPTSWIAPLFVLMGSCSGGALSLYMTINKELFPAWLTGTAMGLMNPAAFLSTALFQPFSGYLMDLVGSSGTIYPVAAYYHVFVAIFVSFVLAVLFIAPLKLAKTDRQ